MLSCIGQPFENTNPHECRPVCQSSVINGQAGHSKLNSQSCIKLCGIFHSWSVCYGTGVTLIYATMCVSTDASKTLACLTVMMGGVCLVRYNTGSFTGLFLNIADKGMSYLLAITSAQRLFTVGLILALCNRRALSIPLRRNN